MKSPTLREQVAIAFRWKQLIVSSFLATFGLLALLLYLQPDSYNAEMKILVKQSRVDPLVTPDPQLPQRVGNLTEQDLTSEAELLKSRDVLERAAIECAVPRRATNVWAWVPVANLFAGTTSGAPARDVVAISRAVRELDERIQAVPLKNSNIITVNYASSNPTRAACILKQVAK